MEFEDAHSLTLTPHTLTHTHSPEHTYSFPFTPHIHTLPQAYALTHFHTHARTPALAQPHHTLTFQPLKTLEEESWKRFTLGTEVFQDKEAEAWLSFTEGIKS